VKCKIKNGLDRFFVQRASCRNNLQGKDYENGAGGGQEAHVSFYTLVVHKEDFPILLASLFHPGQNEEKKVGQKEFKGLVSTVNSQREFTTWN
jgi:hypothetical protein